MDEPPNPTVDAILNAIVGLTARDVSALAAGDRRARGTIAERLWFQLRRGRFAEYQPRIVGVVVIARSLSPMVVSMIDASLDQAIERARSNPSGQRIWTRSPLRGAGLLAFLWTPIILFAIGVGLYSIVPWLAVLAFVAMPTSLLVFVLLARMSPTDSARHAIQAAALGAFIEGGLDPTLRDVLPSTASDVLLEPWREAIEGRPWRHEGVLDRIATWLVLGGILSILILVIGLMITSDASGERIVTPDAAWATALWVSVGAFLVGFGLVALPRLWARGHAP